MAQPDMIPETRPLTAELLNEHLATGGSILLTTCLIQRRYTAKHAGWFGTGEKGGIYVRQGKRREWIAMSDGTLLVSLRLSKKA